ncbi:hypothetical protein NS115_03710 [Paenibacillus jamilae]|uniref:Uncharacterized protein n=1 Tax=Paenibacillus jamilae TaxID=114136 RepID=A0ACC4ZZN8_9BACL|nr:hypothetical protein [Paenibacillus jamilae]KTS84446.1 hypothetical protein NS115_03710 [Paenibacillus jamilae]
MITLSSGDLRVIAIKKKTQAILYRDVQQGDTIRFSMPMDGYWNYASHVRIDNVTQGTSTHKTLAKAAQGVTCFEVEPA